MYPKMEKKNEKVFSYMELNPNISRHTLYHSEDLLVVRMVSIGEWEEIYSLQFYR